MTNKLEGLTILVPESRELDLFASMLEAEGASTLRCPLVRILDLENTNDAERWIEQIIAEPFEDLILLTGEGLRRLIALATRMERREDFMGALAKIRMITRGPKPVRALHEVKLVPGLAAPTPTSQGLLNALAAEDLTGRRIGVQLYPGEGTQFLLASLKERGADLFPVTPYRYASQTQSTQVADAIRGLADGRIGMVAFTSTPQIERLTSVAAEFGLQETLRDGLAKARVASIGPVVEEVLKKQGVTSVIQPVGNFHLKPMVRAIIAAWAAR